MYIPEGKNFSLIFSALFVVLLFFLCSCYNKKISSGFEQGVNLAPVFTYTPENPVTGEKDIYTFAGPLAEYKKEKTGNKKKGASSYQSVFSLRPLINKVKSVDGTKNSFDFLWPLCGRREIGENAYSWCFPCFYISRREFASHEEGEERQYKFYCFPFLYMGRDRYDKFSFAVFPLYGDLYNAGKWKELQFILFPLWSKGKKHDGKVYSLFWPLMEYEKSLKAEGHRILPFYAWKKTDNKRLNFSLLYPFFNYAVSLDKDKNSFAFLLPLLAGYEKWGDYSAISLFWPFFAYRKNSRSNMVDMSLFWPFFRYGYKEGSPQWYSLSFFPFWGAARRKEASTLYILYPFYFATKREKEERINSLQSFFPFFRIRESSKNIRISKNDVGETLLHSDSSRNQSWQIWPFYSRSSSADTVVQKVPDIFPTAGQSAFDRSWSTFFTFYKGRSNKKGLSFNILWGLARSTESKGFSELAIGPFYMHRIRKETAGGKERKNVFLDIFLSMVRIAHDGENSSVRLFWFLEI